MIDLAIVYKADGTVQGAIYDPIPLEHHAGELRKIGASKLCGQGNVAGPVPVVDLCGAPSGRVNAFAIPLRDWEIIRRGAVGALGFQLWLGAPWPDLEIDRGCRLVADRAPAAQGLPLDSGPVLLREIVGRPGRCYRQGDALTDDYLPERVNIEHDENGRISRIWLG